MAEKEYGKIKGSVARTVQGKTSQQPAPAPDRALTAEELAHAKEMKTLWYENFGDDPFIADMVKAGLITGWRNIVSIEPLPQNEGDAPPSPSDLD